MILILPWKTQVVLTRCPLGVVFLIVACIGVFILELPNDLVMSERLHPFVLDAWDVRGIFGSVFLHGGLFHLAFNMWFLWVFGSGVCERLGSLRFIILFLICGLFASGVHVLMDGRPAIGASGAIFGVIGFYLAMYPINRVECFYWVYYLARNSFEISGYWLIALWFGRDLIGIAMRSSDGVGHFAHIGGFLSGLALGLIALKFRWLTLTEYDNKSLLEYLEELFASKRTRQESETPPAPPVVSEAPERRRTPERLPLAPREELKKETAPEAEKARATAGLKPLFELDDLTLNCPFCGKSAQISKLSVGKALKCPSCGQELEVAEG